MASSFFYSSKLCVWLCLGSLGIYELWGSRVEGEIVWNGVFMIYLFNEICIKSVLECSSIHPIQPSTSVSCLECRSRFGHKNCFCYGSVLFMMNCLLLYLTNLQWNSLKFDLILYKTTRLMIFLEIFNSWCLRGKNFVLNLAPKAINYFK